MNLYTSNCRMFAARMRREVERLNAEDCADGRDALLVRWAADARLAHATSWGVSVG